MRASGASGRELERGSLIGERSRSVLRGSLASFSALDEMGEPDRRTDDEEPCEEPNLECLRLAEQCFRSLADAVAKQRNGHRPDERARRVEQKKSPEADIAHADCEWRDRAKSIEDSVAKNEDDVMSVEKISGAGDPGFPSWTSRKEREAVSTAQIEIELIAEKRSKYSHYDHRGQWQIAAMCRQSR